MPAIAAKWLRLYGLDEALLRAYAMKGKNRERVISALQGMEGLVFVASSLTVLEGK